MNPDLEPSTEGFLKAIGHGNRLARRFPSKPLPGHRREDLSIVAINELSELDT